MDQSYQFAAFRRVDLPDGSQLVVEQRRSIPQVQAAVFRYWYILPNGQVVATMECLLYQREAHPFVLGDIEAHPLYRGIGMAHELVRVAEAYERETLYTTGMFTPEGKRSLTFIPLLPDYEPQLAFDSMSFVKSWSGLEAKH